MVRVIGKKDMGKGGKFRIGIRSDGHPRQPVDDVQGDFESLRSSDTLGTTNLERAIVNFVAVILHVAR